MAIIQIKFIKVNTNLIYMITYRCEVIAVYYRRIRELREDNDLLQKNLAALLQVTQEQYSNIENGKSDIKGEKLMKLCVLYNVSADYILGFTDEKKKLPKK